MPKKILLADDSITIQKVVELTFSDGDYEVTAVNNGARAIQKLAEMRPDIILSDIIMPEKNGYEVCEFVKSHPEYRHIPVVLLTGTFEPFDPDRADKAGCDAVVTKPFESQSLILKVEELIEQARASSASRQPAAAAPPPPPASSPAPSPWEEEPPPPPAPSTFSSTPSFNPAPAPFAHDNDIFGAAPRSASAANDMPFAPPPPPPAPAGGETRAIPRMSFDDPQTNTLQAPAGGETRALPRMDFSSLSGMNATPPPPPPTSADSMDESPFGAPPAAEQFSGETRAFPKMTYDDLKNMASQPSPAPPPPPAIPSWDAPPPQGETRAFPQMNFEDLNRAAESSAPAAASKPSSMWDEKPADNAPAWPASRQSPSIDDEVPSPFSSPAASPFGGESAKVPMPSSDEPAWALSSPAPEVSAPSTAAASASTSNGTDLTEEQVDRIARRVIQLMSDQVVRNIAWEVIPDLAEMVVKERIRQLENEN